MNARPIISRVFASSCPTCRNYARSAMSASRNTSALRFSTSNIQRPSLASVNSLSWPRSLDGASRTYRPILTHPGRGYATASKSPASSTSIKVIPPTLESLKTSEEFEDAELVPEDLANIVVTDNAVKVSNHTLSRPGSRNADQNFAICRSQHSN